MASGEKRELTLTIYSDDEPYKYRILSPKTIFSLVSTNVDGHGNQASLYSYEKEEFQIVLDSLSTMSFYVVVVSPLSLLFNQPSNKRNVSLVDRPNNAYRASKFYHWFCPIGI